jgi:hypothetical protein
VRWHRRLRQCTGMAGRPNSVRRGFDQWRRAMNDELGVHMALQTEENSIVSGLHKPRGYVQGLLIEATCVDKVNKLPCGVKRRE